MDHPKTSISELKRIIGVIEQGVRAGTIYSTRAAIPATNYMHDVMQVMQEHQLEHGDLETEFEDLMECIIEIMIVHGSDFEGSHPIVQQLMAAHVFDILIDRGIVLSKNNRMSLKEYN